MICQDPGATLDGGFLRLGLLKPKKGSWQNEDERKQWADSWVCKSVARVSDGEHDKDAEGGGGRFGGDGVLA